MNFMATFSGVCEIGARIFLRELCALQCIPGRRLADRRKRLLRTDDVYENAHCGQRFKSVCGDLSGHALAMEEVKTMANSFDGRLPAIFEKLDPKPLKTTIRTVCHGIIAGSAGGLAEIAWVTLYAVVIGGDPTILARGVTTAVGMSALFPKSAVALGMTVHMTFAITLGIGLAFVWRALSSRRSESTSPYPFVLVALIGVWATNFFVILPIMSPSFIHIAPYPISLISKVLFGLAAAEVLRLTDASARYQSTDQ